MIPALIRSRLGPSGRSPTGPRGPGGGRGRLLGTGLAVLLGVAMVSGTSTLADTMDTSVDRYFTQSTSGVDAVVRNATSVTDEPGARRGGIDAHVLDVVRRTDGVAAAAPVLKGFGQIVGADGDAVTGNGPRVAGNWATDAGLNPWSIVDGHPPRGPSEVVIDKNAAETGDLSVGQTTTVLTPEPVPVTVVGIATFGASDTFGGTSFTAFTLDGADEHLTHGAQKLTSVSVRAEDGVSEETVVDHLRQRLPQDSEALTGTALAAENLDSVQQSFLNVFRMALTAFAAIAMLVAAFSIYNTFSIIAAQRRRETALLRVVGATRRQVIGAALIEALAIGAVASALGLAGGVALAFGLKGVFAGFGVTLPTIELVVTGSSLATSASVGILVTVLSALVPAIRGSRVPPVAALRESAVEDRVVSRRRAAGGVLLVVTGVTLTVVGSVGAGIATTAAGAAVLVLGMLALGPWAVRPVSRVVGWPAARGLTWTLARENARRSPRRTAGAANALLIGVGLVTLASVLAASVQSSVEDRVGEAFAGDLVVTAGTGMGAAASLSPDVADALAEVPHTSGVAALTDGTARVDDESVAVSVGEPAKVSEVLSLRTTAGTLGPHAFAVSESVAHDHGWQVGNSVPVTFADGAREPLRLSAVYADSRLIGDYLLPSSAWAPHATQDLDSVVYLTVAPGTDVSDIEAAAKDAVEPYGGPTVMDRTEYVDAQGRGVGMLLNLVYVMLALAIVIALMGILNTLSLSVRERTHEIGLLRAVGQTRPQTRRMVRRESLIVAVLGTVGGVALGVFLGAMVALAIDDVGMVDVPVPTLAIVLVVGGIAGMLAGRRPARRAARTDVLTAIAAD